MGSYAQGNNRRGPDSALEVPAVRILLTLDGSEFSESAIPLALRLAHTPDSEVHLLTVIEPAALGALRALAAEGRAPGVAWLSVEPEEEGPEAAAAASPDLEFVLEHYLEMVARLFPDAVVKPVVRVGLFPAEQIAAYAEANAIDLIVMSTHGRTGLERVLHGSVAGQVMRAGVAPVALIRPGKVAA
jgi:nucleotide-binding universal stress UspA family protein